MKIGFSLGRCVRDIVKGSVDINDVAFIIAATSIHDEPQLANVKKLLLSCGAQIKYYSLVDKDCTATANLKTQFGWICSLQSLVKIIQSSLHGMPTDLCYIW